MTRHDDEVRLRHMLERAMEAVAMAQERARAELDQDRMLELSLVRLVEVVGEAAARISEEGRSRWPSIPWAQARGMRNRLIHGYDKVDLDVLWDTVRRDFPPLIEQLQKLLGRADSSDSTGAP